jgi:hypothetical protein
MERRVKAETERRVKAETEKRVKAETEGETEVTRHRTGGMEGTLVKVPKTQQAKLSRIPRQMVRCYGLPGMLASDSKVPF